MTLMDYIAKMVDITDGEWAELPSDRQPPATFPGRVQEPLAVPPSRARVATLADNTRSRLAQTTTLRHMANRNRRFGSLSSPPAAVQRPASARPRFDPTLRLQHTT